MEKNLRNTSKRTIESYLLCVFLYYYHRVWPSRSQPHLRRYSNNLRFPLESQQDVQAQARCHRIGQDRPVMVYRLVTKNTYEAQMFDRASKKLGLDHAILSGLSNGGNGERKNSNAEFTPLLDKCWGMVLMRFWIVVFEKIVKKWTMIFSNHVL